MFEQTFVEGGKTRTPFAVLMSFLLQCLIIGVLILIPLIYTDTLPSTQLTSFLTAPPPPPPPPPPPVAAEVKIVRQIPRQFDAGRLLAPKSIPKDIAMIKEDEAPPPSAGMGVVGGVGGGMVGGMPGGVIGGMISNIPVAAPPPPPPVKAAAPAAPQRIRVGGNVQEARLSKKIVPTYPPLARSARIAGVVRFNAVIGTDGRIQNLQLVTGHPLLVPSAQAAVSQWVYQPTLLNGEPVEVMTQIDVNFTLQ
jgi:protein TonB